MEYSVTLIRMWWIYTYYEKMPKTYCKVKKTVAKQYVYYDIVHIKKEKEIVCVCVFLCETYNHQKILEGYTRNSS